MKYRDWHIWLGIICCILLLFVLLAGTAGAHSWYDEDCCDTKDCTPATNIEYHDGYQIWHTKLFKPIKIRNHEFNGDFFSVRASQDQYHHICAFEWFGPNIGSKSENKLSTRVRCVYLPGTS